MRKLALPYMLCCLFCTLLHALHAQTGTTLIARGQVKDNKGQPVYGAVVKEKSLPSNATSTDSAGNFHLALKGASRQIMVTHVGFKRLEMQVSEQPVVLTLEVDEAALSDVVIIGYQTQKRRNVTAAVSSINGKDIANIPQSSFDQTLQGRLAGVSVLSSTGELGARPAIVIRGSTNVDYSNANGGNTGPLYVIDGIIYDLNTIGSSYGNNNPLSLINPNDIETIDVLKDASASAIYGARAGNGVIIVKTKRAKMGKPQVTASAYVGVTTRPNFRHVYTGNAERDLKLALLNQQLPYSTIALGQIPVQLTDSLNPAFNNSVDWQGLMIRNNAVVHSEDVAIAGYMGNNSYRLSFNHYNEQGILNGYSLDRLAPHLNLTIRPVSRMSITTDLFMSAEKRNHGVGGSTGSLFNSWSFPTSLVQLTPEQYATYKGNQSYYDDNRIFTIVGSVGLLDTIVPNLTFNSNFAASNYSDKYAYFSPKEINGLQNTAYNIDNSNPSWSFENYLTYSRQIKKHHLAVSAGTSSYSNKNYYDYASAKGISVTGITTIQTVPSGANLYVNTSYQRKTTVSYYGRLIYSYNDKYLFTASVRRDASSIYSADYRWGTFPAFSAGWIASDEPFFEPLKNTVNFLKFRASWGITGNDPGSWYAKYQTLYNDASYLNGTTGTLQQDGSYTTIGGVPSTYNGTTVITPYPYNNYIYTYGVKSSNDVRWEKVPQLDFGADMELFKGRIALTVDWYRKDTKDKYFYNIPAQATSGYAYYAGNFVNIRNEGLEIAINTRNLGPTSAFQWNTNFNVSFNKNYVTKLPNGNRDFIFGQPWFQQTFTLGEPLFNYKVFQVNGVYATNADVPTDPVTGKKMTFQGVALQAGDAKYVDNNGDYNIDYNDKVIAGNPMPKVTGGFGNTFSYKGFSLQVFCSFLTGRKVFNGSLSDYLNGSRAYTSWGAVSGPAAITEILNQFWQKPGDQTTFPRLVYPNGTAQDPWNIAGSYFVEDGSFIKVKNVTLSYSLPAAWARKIGMKRVNIYGMADNVHIFKKSKLIADPELADPTTGSVNVVYPSALKFTMGVNIEL